MSERSPKTWLSILIAILALGVAPSFAMANDTSVTADVTTGIESTDETGVAVKLGPQLSLNGPPTAVKLDAAFHHHISHGFAFQGNLAAAFGGETSFESDGVTPDANYESTAGAEVAAGVRYALPFAWEPLKPYATAVLAFDVTGGEELIGFMFGPTVGFGATYALDDSLSLVAEAQWALGYGQYKGSNGEFATTLDLLFGAMVTF